MKNSKVKLEIDICVLNAQAFGKWYLEVNVDGQWVEQILLTEEQALLLIKSGVNHQG